MYVSKDFQHRIHIDKPQGQQLFQIPRVFKGIVKCLSRDPETCTGIQKCRQFQILQGWCSHGPSYEKFPHYKNSYTSQKSLQCSGVWCFKVIGQIPRPYRICLRKGSLKTN